MTDEEYKEIEKRLAKAKKDQEKITRNARAHVVPPVNRPS